ncbi:MAG: hypothetical protein J1E34_02655 [Oscillospiraceae bacterium]|nr:hypothetical protein [Oscillospiraceae bacterium]
MRNLTIRRTKTFVACLAKLKVYIEDPASTELTINNIPCRKIGELKNGEEKTFQIDESEAKVFVIADKMSKNFCNDYYQLPYGQENIFLSGKPKYNPASGNAFRFDNNNSPDIAANRKKGTQKGLIILIAAIIVGAVIGYTISSGLFSSKTPQPKTFSSDGISITLTDEFRKSNLGNFTVTFDSKDVAVFALEESFSLVEGFEEYTLEQYADLVIEANGLDSSEIKTSDGLTYFEYEFTNTQTKETYRYFSFVYKTNDAFWMVQFATIDENAEEYFAQITQWAKSVEFVG